MAQINMSNSTNVDVLVPDSSSVAVFSNSGDAGRLYYKYNNGMISAVAEGDVTPAAVSGAIDAATSSLYESSSLVASDILFYKGDGSADIISLPDSSLPSGLLSSSAQIATEISGAFTDTSASIASDIAAISSSFYYSSSIVGSTVTFHQGGGTTQDVSVPGASPGGVSTRVQYNDGGVFAGDSGMSYDKVNSDLTLAGRVIAQQDMKAENLFNQGFANGNYVDPIAATSAGVFVRSTDNPLVGSVRSIDIAASNTYILNSTSLINLAGLNAGRAFVFPGDGNCTLQFGFAAGNSGGTSWNKDYRISVYNMGAAASDTTNQNYDLEITIVTPNDSGGSFTIYTIGENGAGTSQFSRSVVSANSGHTLPDDVRNQGFIDLMMSYDDRTIVVWGKSIV